jgi:hypothetical protein
MLCSVAANNLVPRWDEYSTLASLESSSQVIEIGTWGLSVRVAVAEQVLHSILVTTCPDMPRICRVFDFLWDAINRPIPQIVSAGLPYKWLATASHFSISL